MADVPTSYASAARVIVCQWSSVPVSDDEYSQRLAELQNSCRQHGADFRSHHRDLPALATSVQHQLTRDTPLVIVVNDHGAEETGAVPGVTAQQFWQALVGILPQQRGAPVYILAVQCHGLFFARQLQDLIGENYPYLIVNGPASHYTTSELALSPENASRVREALHNELDMALSVIVRRELYARTHQ